MSRLHFLVVALSLFLVACSSPKAPKNSSAMPSWVLQPSVSGKIGAIGVAGRTYDQSISSQRKLAIGRALDELSLQKGVQVAIRMQKKEVANNSGATYKMKDKSTYSANNKITAHIEGIWMDKSSKELYIWMVLDN
ncbi:MAG: hypothetical protein Q9M40_13495 [Sulfurimonas sp.]|nr:hypothetical protein [Sulfurimonas sp.]